MIKTVEIDGEKIKVTDLHSSYINFMNVSHEAVLQIRRGKRDNLGIIFHIL